MKSVYDIILMQLQLELDTQVSAQAQEIETSKQFKGIMESQHDTFKQEAHEKSVALGKRISELEASIQTLRLMRGACADNHMCRVFELAGKTTMRIILAPNSARDYKNIKIISANAPVGRALLAADVGDTLKIGNDEFEIKSIKENVE